MKPGDLADSIRTARLKRRALRLRHFADVPKHLTRPGEVKTTSGPQLSQRRQHVMRAVDVRVHRRKAIGKTFCHEALRRQVITLLKIVLAEDMENTRITLEIRRMQGHAVQQVSDATESRFRRLEGHPAHQSMDLIPQAQQIFGEVTPVLPRYSSNQRPLRHTPVLICNVFSQRHYQNIDNCAFTAERSLLILAPSDA